MQGIRMNFIRVDTSPLTKTFELYGFNWIYTHSMFTCNFDINSHRLLSVRLFAIYLSYQQNDCVIYTNRKQLVNIQ